MAELRDIQVEFKYSWFALPRSREQVAGFEKTAVGLPGQCTDRFAERLGIDQICE
jgi:hypothetical protein